MDAFAPDGIEIGGTVFPKGFWGGIFAAFNLGHE